MFTGIVTNSGTIRRARADGDALDIDVEAPGVARQLAPGDSVSVNGVCLTATRTGRRRFAARVVAETLARSTLGQLRRGNTVNLELPARPVDRLGGHLVQGHVDATAEVTRIQDEDGARRVWLSTGEDLLRYIAPKGSIALDGVSLTVADAGLTTFQVVLIPHTLEATTLGDMGVGSVLNVEVDVIAKYVERLAGSSNRKDGNDARIH
ncbi:MAG: riboflavin synthase [Actinomycetota bacterium]|nr:riboflavin synthase [Actinomycetota bacterium]